MKKAEGNSKDGVRKRVSEFYARSVAAQKPSCCGGSLPKGVAAKTAGYKPAELASIPEDAVVNSFGCGNPLGFSGVKPGETVLDLGSGAGIDLLVAAQKVGPGGKVIGVDMTDEMIKKARLNIKKAGLKNVDVRKGIIEDLPVEAGSVDWVISNCVINLSPEKHRVFAEIFRVLKPGGRISVSDIVAEDLPDWIRSNAELYSSCIAGSISEKDYLAGLKAAGMTDVKVVDRFVYEVSQMTGMVESELPSSCGCGCSPDKDTAMKIAGALEGRVWSAKITARKPLKRRA
jgi:SAM-dependent methyltransferase